MVNIIHLRRLALYAVVHRIKDHVQMILGVQTLSRAFVHLHWKLYRGYSPAALSVN